MLVGALIVIGGGYAGAMFMGVTDPATLNVGYAPPQPIPYSHELHAGQLKIDCRYCHNTVFEAAHAAIPPTAVCINCHSPLGEEGEPPALGAVHEQSESLQKLHESWRTGESVQWKRVHNLPDFVYFNHAVHVNSGVSCVRCHGRVDKMEVVYQAEELSMAWCIDCHRNYEEHIRPIEFVTQLDWQPEGDPAELGKQLAAERNLNPQDHCGVCHR